MPPMQMLVVIRTRRRHNCPRFVAFKFTFDNGTQTNKHNNCNRHWPNTVLICWLLRLCAVRQGWTYLWFLDVWFRPIVGSYEHFGSVRKQCNSDAMLMHYIHTGSNPRHCIMFTISRELLLGSVLIICPLYSIFLFIIHDKFFLYNIFIFVHIK